MLASAIFTWFFHHIKQYECEISLPIFFKYSNIVFEVLKLISKIIYAVKFQIKIGVRKHELLGTQPLPGNRLVALKYQLLDFSPGVGR